MLKHELGFIFLELLVTLVVTSIVITGIIVLQLRIEKLINSNTRTYIRSLKPYSWSEVLPEELSCNEKNINAGYITQTCNKLNDPEYREFIFIKESRL